MQIFLETERLTLRRFTGDDTNRSLSPAAIKV
jgi:hypothetical protein